jgi:hypothetical protein
VEVREHRDGAHEILGAPLTEGNLKALEKFRADWDPGSRFFNRADL